MAVDLNQLEDRVRLAYEKGRVFRALARSAPLLGIGVLVMLLDHRPAIILSIDALLFVTGVLLLWRGQEIGRGMLAGLVAGGFPLLFGMSLQGYQLLCHSPALMPSCVAVCSLGGLVAGLLIAWSASRRPTTPSFVLSAGVVALLMGTLGCACAGLVGVLGLVGGLSLPILANRIRAARQVA